MRYCLQINALDIVNLEDAKAETIAGALEKVIGGFGLLNKVVAIAADNTSINNFPIGKENKQDLISTIIKVCLVFIAILFFLVEESKKHNSNGFTKGWKI